MSLDQSMTLHDMRTRVCERLGIADRSGTVAAPTTDTMELDLVDRCIHDAIRELWRAVDPRTRRAAKFSFTAPSVTITLDDDGDGPRNIDGDPTRYLLPQGVCSAPLGKVTWADPSNAGCGGVVFAAGIDAVQRRVSESPEQTGPPLYCAVTPALGVQVPKGARTAMELRVFPIPDRALTLTARFKSEPTILVNGEDRGNWPAAHDMTIVDLATYAMVAMGGITSGPSREDAKARADASVVASIEEDEQSKTISVGVLGGDRSSTYDRTPAFVTGDGTTVTF